MTTIPPGYYAIEIHDSDEYDVDDPRFCEHVGYHLVEVTKRGRIKRSSQQFAGIEPGRFLAILHDERDMYGQGHDLSQLQLQPDEERPDLHQMMLDHYRADFGKVTGRCGCCGRTLTDPKSKVRGIGPECAKPR